jgi:type II secretory pathway pseudopilin PulG
MNAKFKMIHAKRALPGRKINSSSWGSFCIDHFEFCMGFTLIELVVVLFCMVVAAATFIPRYTTYQRASQARDTARSVMALVREAREIAVEKQRPVILAAIPQQHCIALQFDDTLLPPDPNDPNAGADTLPRAPLYYPDTMTAEVRLAQETISTTTSGQMTFTPDGRVPDADILIQFAPDRALQVTSRRQATVLEVADAASAGTSSPRGMRR